jgi:hypothetical protein
MHSVKLEWHQHNIDLQAAEAHIKTLFPSCVGNSADSALTFWFSEVLTEEQEEIIRTYWASLDASSNEAQSYVSQEQLDAALSALKSGLISKTWDSMSAAERKFVLGQSLTKTELGF